MGFMHFGGPVLLLISIDYKLMTTENAIDMQSK